MAKMPWRLIFSYLLCSALCSAMVVYRYAVTGKTTYAWLVVPNLVLAWMPFGFAVALELVGWRRRWVSLALGGLWLLFFPNAPYIVTDFVHLTWVNDLVSIYFDIALVGLAAVTGLGLGFNSLAILQDQVERSFSRAVGWVFVLATWVLTSVGIYLGRVERWNSWDALRSPLAILADVAAAARGGELLPIIASFSLVMAVLYVTFRASAHREPK
ncbi:MAG: hypothetical protein K0R39_3982 [Symbiobacteriaceae bacterium]|jgi:uncharacterized membrane protein|nr:hypothetical protein [Symbiobacteriaceae bacterium]